MTLAPVRPRCGGSCVDRDYEGVARCLQCARPARPIVLPTLVLAPRFRDDMGQTIARERRIIDAAARVGAYSRPSRRED